MSTPEFLQGLLTHEQPLFHKVVAAVVEPGLDYRPDPKSRCSRELIGHLIGHFLDLSELADEGTIHHRNQVPFETLPGALEQLDAGFQKAIESLAATDAGLWMTPGKFFVGDNLIMEAPRQQLAWILFLDAVHHRGQLTTHLRAMGSKVPSIYGPSADEQVKH